MTKQLNENLRMLDLVDMVSPTLNVDEFKSKIDKDNIVSVFYLTEKEPAAELKSFLEKSFFDVILDIEISQYPNKDGFYHMFCEMERDAEYPKNITDILRSVFNLTGIRDWTFKPYQHNEVVPLNKKTLTQHVRLHHNVLEESVKSFFKAIDMPCDYNYDKSQLVLESYTGTQTFDVQNVFDAKEYNKYMKENFKVEDLNETFKNCFEIDTMFESKCSVMAHDNMYFVEHNEKYLVIEKTLK